MSSNYKEKFYSKYISTHNQYLYGSTPSLEGFRRQFPVWQRHYGKFLPESKNAHIIDLGCGDSGLVYWLQEIGFAEASGIDVSAEQIEIARKLGVKNVSQADIRDFLRDKRDLYDVVFLRDVLGHFFKSEILEILGLVRDSLKSGGIVVVKIPNAESPFSGRLRYGDFTHDVSFTESSLRQVLLISGFGDARAYSTPPVIHGLKSAVRYVLWKIVELFLRFYRLVDAGTGVGIFTQNVIAVARK